MLVLDTSSVPSRDRLDLVVESMTGAAMATSFAPATGRDGVHLSMSSWDLGGVELVDTEVSANTLTRTGRRVTSETAPTLLLTTAIFGFGVHSHLDNQIRVRPSTLWATDLTSEYVHDISDTRTVTAKIPTDALGMRHELVRASATRLHLSALAPMFTSHVHDVRRVADDLDHVAGRAVATATISLARALLASVADEDRLRRDALEDTLLLRVKAFARSHLGDPRLNAEMIAAAHHVSVRHLYRTCARAGLRLEPWIIEQRLAGAAEDIARSPRRSLSIGRIAHRWGFTSTSHFATRFRAAYGHSPREWQALNQPARNPVL